MARFSTLLLAVAAATCVSAGPLRRAGPACASKYRGAPDCVQKCKDNWGWGSAVFGSSRAGYVVLPAELSAQLEVVVAQACGSNIASIPVATPPAANIPPANAAPLPSETAKAVVSSAPVVASSVPAARSSIVVAPSSSSAAPIVSSAPNLAAARPRSTSSSVRTSSVRASSSVRPTTRAAPITTSTPAPRPTTTTAKPPAQATTAAPGGGGGSTGGSTGGSGGDKQVWLDQHNTVRARHGANALTWDDALAAAAQKWANNCVWKHSGGAVGPYGENLAVGSGSSYPAASGFKGWADEVSDYNPNSPVPSHFTQVVWKATTKLGCATAICPVSMMPGWEKYGSTVSFHVCEYNPPGNFNNDYAKNVQV